MMKFDYWKRLYYEWWIYKIFFTSTGLNMIKYKWIVSFIISLFIVHYLYNYYFQYSNNHRIELMSSNEIQRIIDKIEKSSLSPEVLVLYNYYIIHHEHYNAYLIICHMNKNVEQEVHFKSRVSNYLKYHGNFSLNKCPSNPLNLIKNRKD